MIALTDKAADKVKEILNAENKEGLGLRVGIKGGGCSGFSYTLNFDKPNSEIDQVFEDKGIKIIIDSKCLRLNRDYVIKITGISIIIPTIFAKFILAH